MFHGYFWRPHGHGQTQEYHHPAMAVETARARINLAATLSEDNGADGGRSMGGWSDF